MLVLCSGKYVSMIDGILPGLMTANAPYTAKIKHIHLMKEMSVKKPQAKIPLLAATCG